jgi:hypothetical protein
MTPGRDLEDEVDMLIVGADRKYSRFSKELDIHQPWRAFGRRQIGALSRVDRPPAA